ncbi:hypothetical protein L226DRAFT_615703 [Lentinus tigrinus ALCF2SS1-7]|uniref:Uncharacterized protein n=1 Tax=Lentinus tigrinus ALCF2SS1-6 TaxID=1328759 RepID=A0A5C2S0D1_9APHY|nr:hypothetical protein L227DRAFT_246011 [Lentinus tigrinus ALCF2SS1-6]RPD71192.1 hypothetical protein L226DRAFT_615703 [Lentinus tigrinus ALCF2SS1-7]
MPLFDIALPKPFVKALVGGKGKGKGNKGAGDKRRPSWVRLGRSIATKGRIQSQEKNRLQERASKRSGAGTLRKTTSSPCVHLEPTEDRRHYEPNLEHHGHGNVDEEHDLTRQWTRMPHDAASPREARYSLSAADDGDFDENSVSRPESSLSFGGKASSEASDSSDDTAVPSEGTATPVNNLSRSPSYKKDAGHHMHSPYQSWASSPLAEHPPSTVVYPYGLRLVPKREGRAPQDEYFDKVLANMHSFVPLHSAMAFNGEGQGVGVGVGEGE